MTKPVIAFCVKLQIVIFIKFCRMRNCRKLTYFFSLGLNEIIYKLLREYSACCEVIVVSLKSVKSRVKRSRKLSKLCLFFFRKMEEVHIVWSPSILVRINLVLRAIWGRTFFGIILFSILLLLKPLLLAVFVAQNIPFSILSIFHFVSAFRVSKFLLDFLYHIFS